MISHELFEVRRLPCDMTEPTDKQPGLIAKAGSLASSGGKATLNGLKWLAPRAKRAGGKAAAGIRTVANGLASRLKQARANTDETSRSRHGAGEGSTQSPTWWGWLQTRKIPSEPRP
jgi:hypothetical protein